MYNDQIRYDVARSGQNRQAWEPIVEELMAYLLLQRKFLVPIFVIVGLLELGYALLLRLKLFVVRRFLLE